MKTIFNLLKKFNIVVFFLLCFVMIVNVSPVFAAKVNAEGTKFAFTYDEEVRVGEIPGDYEGLKSLLLNTIAALETENLLKNEYRDLAITTHIKAVEAIDQANIKISQISADIDELALPKEPLIKFDIILLGTVGRILETDGIRGSPLYIGFTPLVRLNNLYLGPNINYIAGDNGGLGVGFTLGLRM